MAKNKPLSADQVAAINHRVVTEGARDPEGTMTIEGISVAEAARRHAEASRQWHEQLSAATETCASEAASTIATDNEQKADGDEAN